jgi:hypothetical protein
MVYFRTLRRLMWLFVVMSVLTVPIFALNVAYDSTSPAGCPEDGLPICMLSTTLGNVPSPALPTGSSWSRMDDSEPVRFRGRTMARTDMFLARSLLDTLCAVVFMLGVAWIGRRQREEVAAQLRRVTTAGRFTVQVWGLPLDATPPRIKTFCEHAPRTPLACILMIRTEDEMNRNLRESQSLLRL